MLKLLGLVLMTGVVLPLSAAERTDIGLSTQGTVIERSLVSGAPSSHLTVLLIGGLNGRDASSERVEKAVREYEKRDIKRRPYRLLAVSISNPEATPLQFPATGVAYRENIESNVLWRWIGTQAPDLVLIASPRDYGLADALSDNSAAEVGKIPARVAPAKGDLLELNASEITPSEAHREIERRLARTPRQLADELAQYYGHDFDPPLYIQAIALIAQAKLGHLDEVRRLVEPYVTGEKNALARPNSLVLAGHMVFT